MKEFGIDFTEEDLKLITRPYSNLRRTFYTMKAEQLRGLSRKYKIDYVIMDKEYQKYHKNEI